MLKLITVLLIAANFVGGEESPNVWGSRIITQSSGSYTLDLQLKYGLNKDFCSSSDGIEWLKVSIEGEKCIFSGGYDWGAPCSYDESKGKALITVVDVKRQYQLKISAYDKNKKVVVFYIVFAPDCYLPKPRAGEVIVKESIPLSRFVKGQSNVPLTFAVEGMTGGVNLYKNGNYWCQWQDAKFINGNDCASIGGDGKNLLVDTENNMRIFKKKFPLPTSEDLVDYYEWISGHSRITVTVDANQAGQSPEVEVCVATTTTESTTTTPTTTTTEDPSSSSSETITNTTPEQQGPPKLWGSRIVTQSNGSYTLDLDFKYGLKSDFNVYSSIDSWFKVFIKGDKCMTMEESEWGSQCSYDANTGKALITVKDVREQSHLVIFPYTKGKEEVNIYIIFVPDCKFPKPGDGEVIPEESIPLSRFVRGQENVPVTFAVDILMEWVVLKRNGLRLCQWNETGLTSGSVEDCASIGGSGTDLIFDFPNKMRKFKKEFPLPTTDDLVDYYEWTSKRNMITVTIDANQKGQSPEVENCAAFTTTVTTETLTDPTTTSAASEFGVSGFVTNLCLVIALVDYGK